MAQTVNVNFKLDADVKKRMEQVCSELGLSMSAAFTVFAKKVGREQRIPFELSTDIPNVETIQAIKEVQDLKKNSNKKTYDSFSEILAEMEQDDEV